MTEQILGSLSSSVQVVMPQSKSGAGSNSVVKQEKQLFTEMVTFGSECTASSSSRSTNNNNSNNHDYTHRTAGTNLSVADDTASNSNSHSSRGSSISVGDAATNSDKTVLDQVVPPSALKRNTSFLKGSTEQDDGGVIGSNTISSSSVRFAPETASERRTSLVPGVGCDSVTGAGTASGLSSTGSASGDTRASSKDRSRILKTSRTVFYGRYLFVIFLIVVAALLGYLAYKLMSDAEDQIASERFDSISERALSTAQLVIQEKKKATDSLALMMASSNPDADAWPNVYMEGYESIASSLGVITEGSLSFCPIVIPGGEEQRSFEAFAYNLFHDVSGYDKMTGVSAFGKGVFSYGTGEYGNETWPDGRFHIQSGWTYHSSPRKILLPFLQSDWGAHASLMLNVHFEHNRAAAIDNTIQCAEERAKAKDDDMICGSITDLMWSETAADIDPGPAGLMMVPIYPRNDKYTLTGFIVGKQIWSDLLKHGFEYDVNGLDVVLRTDDNAHTYRIQGGEAVYLTPGDVHDPNARYSLTGTHINPLFFSNTTVKYYMDIYSTDEFTQSYSTTNPRVACIGAVLIIVFTSIVFFLFDYFVRKEFHDKKKLLEAKRHFVRFVSHEVRTPLNTVCMGLTLLRHEFASALGVRATNSNGVEVVQASKHGKDQQITKFDKFQVQEWMNLCTQIFENADEAVTVLSDLLNYDKIQMGTLTLELSLINPWNTVQKTIHEFTLSAYEKGVKMTLDLSPLKSEEKGIDVEFVATNSVPSDLQVCRVVGDNVRLSQVLRNLLSNGLKFSKEKGNLTIRVSEVSLPKRKRKEKTFSLHNYEEEIALTRRGWVVIEVIDDGVGMTPGQVATVFDDGTQFNANQHQAGGGSGLGLSIAKGIVKEHGGKLSCSSEGLGCGSTFVLSLPLYESDGETDPASKLHLKEASMGDSKATKEEEFSREEDDCEFVLPKMRILVVDDVATNRKLCIRLLERSGHTCDGACDGKEAVEMVRKSLDDSNPYDCILLDYEMPKMNGPEACQRMRKLGCSSYIAGVTGNVMSEDVDHFRSCGANWVLPKPFRLETLEEQLMEDGFGTQEKEEDNLVVRVDSSGALVQMGDEVAISLQEGTGQS